MQTNIHPLLAPLPEVQEADAILRSCVHCGFCTATCPTYQLLGDELDGPRGRIYLIKNLLEDNTISQASADHLDRCLTCRSCETTCPSGVSYGRLLDIGRSYAADRVRARLLRRVLSVLIRFVIPRRTIFRPLLALGQFLRPAMPKALATHVPPRQPARHEVQSSRGARVLLLTGCVQSAATPNVVASLMKILASQGVTAELVDEGCCGALDYHLSAHETGKARMRRVIDLLHQRIDEIDYIVSSATGCGVTVTEYPDILKYESGYAEKAEQIVAKTVDAVTLLEQFSFQTGGGSVAVHTPCSMQHGMKLVGRIEAVMQSAGYSIVPHVDGHLCCGSAGTYSILQPDLSTRLRDQKVSNLLANDPEVVVTANVGCQLHLGEGSNVPVMHWLEYLADGVSGQDKNQN